MDMFIIVLLFFFTDFVPAVGDLGEGNGISATGGKRSTIAPNGRKHLSLASNERHSSLSPRTPRSTSLRTSRSSSRTPRSTSLTPNGRTLSPPGSRTPSPPSSNEKPSSLTSNGKHTGNSSLIKNGGGTAVGGNDHRTLTPLKGGPEVTERTTDGNLISSTSGKTTHGQLTSITTPGSVNGGILDHSLPVTTSVPHVSGTTNTLGHSSSIRTSKSVSGNLDQATESSTSTTKTIKPSTKTPNVKTDTPASTSKSGRGNGQKNGTANGTNVVASSAAAWNKLQQELGRFSSDKKKAGEYGKVKNILDQIMKVSRTKIGTPGKQQKVPKLNTANPDDETELARNGPVLQGLFEGDIMLTEGQAKNILEDIQKENNGQQSRKDRVKRKVIRDPTMRWPSNVLHYTFDSDIDSYKISIIKSAMKAWEETTCLRFEEGTGNGDYVTFFSGSGCYGHVGVAGGQQGISIGDGCEAVGIAAHELGHAMGFWHEQNRYDRDSYVDVEYENIDPFVYGNFMRIPRRMMIDYGVPYDLGSVMHYGAKAFASDWDVTSIRTLDPNHQYTIGQRQSLSFIDVKQMNRAYCSDTCRNQLSCLHDGYPDPGGGGSRCNQCRCPTGFGGTLCETSQDSDSGCGGMITASNEWQTILVTSPTRRCNWLLKAGNGGHITLEVIAVNVRCRPACRGFLEVKKGPNFDQTGYRFCCRNTWSTPITSAANEMAVILRAEPTNAGTWDVQFRFRTDVPGSNPGPSAVNAQGGGGGQGVVRTMSDGTWTAWGPWSQCSVSCGGCGKQERRRECSGTCGTGEKLETRACGEAVCGGGSVAVINAMCQGTETVPCRRIKRRKTGFMKSRTKTNSGKEVKDFPIEGGTRRRRQNGCGTRTVNFMCTQSNPRFVRLLTNDELKSGVLAGGWNKQPTGATGAGKCCNGFERQGDVCRPRRPD